MNIIIRWQAVLMVFFTVSVIQAEDVSINLSGPSNDWTAVLYGAKFDGPGDTQSGKDGVDLIGDLTHPLMYTMYDDQGTVNQDDDEIAFRLRINGDNAANYFFIGIDANEDGVLDLFISVDDANQNAIQFWDPGDDLNISPNTTSIAKNPHSSIATTSENFTFMEVISVDPSATADIGGDGTNDHFISFKFPFSAMKQAMYDVTNSAITIDKNSSMRYLTLSLTQPNSINGDFGGVDDDNDDLSRTFDQLEMYSPVLTPAGVTPAINTVSSLTVVNGQQDVVTITTLGLDISNQTFSIVGGTDASQFTLDSKTGALRFVTAPDTANPLDSDGDNEYRVTVQSTDGEIVVSKTIIVTVVPPDDPNFYLVNITNQVTLEDTPITIPFTVEYEPDNKLVVTVTAADQLLVPNENITVSLETQSNGKYNGHGTITILPGTDLSGVTQITVSATDGTYSDVDAFNLQVNPVNDYDPVITSDGGEDTAEVHVTEGSVDVTTVTATDQDGMDDMYFSISVSGGVDHDKFIIDESTGELVFKVAPSASDPTDTNGDNVYMVEVQVSDGRGGVDTQLLSVVVVPLTPALGVVVTLSDGILTWSVEEEISVKQYEIVELETGRVLEVVLANGQSQYSIELPSDVGAAVIRVVDNNGFSQLFTPVRGSLITVNYQLEKGWNLISLPGKNAGLAELKSAISGGIWGWTGSAYEIEENPLACQAFWVYSRTNVLVTIVVEESDDSMVLNSGWNLVGPKENMKVPDEAFSVFSWDNTYQGIATEHGVLLQGVGYWIFSK